MHAKSIGCWVVMLSLPDSWTLPLLFFCLHISHVLLQATEPILQDILSPTRAGSQRVLAHRWSLCFYGIVRWERILVGQLCRRVISGGFASQTLRLVPVLEQELEVFTKPSIEGRIALMCGWRQNDGPQRRDASPWFSSEASLQHRDKWKWPICYGTCAVSSAHLSYIANAWKFLQIFHICLIMIH